MDTLADSLTSLLPIRDIAPGVFILLVWFGAKWIDIRLERIKEMNRIDVEMRRVELEMKKLELKGGK